MCMAAEACLRGTGHAADSEDEERSSGAGQLAGEDSSGSSDDEAQDAATALPWPLPETEAEAPPSEADGPSTSGREHAVGSPAALSPDLVTLALLPRSQWQGLVHLDAIKVSIQTHTASVLALCQSAVRIAVACSGSLCGLVLQ